jgi:hypothetical protein
LIATCWFPFALSIVAMTAALASCLLAAWNYRRVKRLLRGGG